MTEASDALKAKDDLIKKLAAKVAKYLPADELLREGNELLRSASEIAKRDGGATNWKAYRKRLGPALKRQREYMNNE